MIYFTSDLHFHHKNVIPYCNRPFKDIVEMNEMLIAYWNEVVKPDDIVYILGDFSFGTTPKKEAVALRLMGTKFIVLGNHDDKAPATWRRCNFGVTPQGKSLWGFNLSHFPYRNTEFDDRDFSMKQLEDDGNWLLHGHVHCGWKTKNKMINVGVDVWNYRPVSIDVLKEMMA